MLRYVLPLIAFIVSVPLVAQSPPSQAEQRAIDLAAERGALIYAYDQAAWHGTDDMMAKIPNAVSVVGGWVVDGSAAEPTLVFFDRDQREPHAIYMANFKNGRLISSRIVGEGTDNTLTATRLALIAARKQAINAFAKAGVKPCGAQQPNTVVLPPTVPGAPTLVYLLTPQADLRTFPIGGNYRIEVNADGTTANLRAFANTCIAMKLPEQKPEMFFVSHLLDPVPTEIHVFAALASQVPVGVGTTTNNALWAVSNSSIRFVSTIKPNN